MPGIMKRRMLQLFRRMQTIFFRVVRPYARQGFTINEILVVLAITVFLSGMLLSYNRSSEKQITLFKDRSYIVGVLNRSKSLAEERFIGSGGQNACAFGVRIDITSQKLVLFQDIKPGTDVFTCKNLNGTYSPSEDTPGFFYSGSSPELLEEYALSPRVIMTASAGGSNVSAIADILFVPPEISATSTVSFPIIVTLKDLTGTNSSTVTILSNGQIATQ